MLRILENQQQVQEARAALRRAGCDSSRGWRRKMFTSLFTLRYRSFPPPVAINKSWDVLMMLNNIVHFHPDRDALIFDMGSFNSEIPLGLWMSGYRNLRAADLDPRGRSIRWYGTGIDFRCENFYSPSLPPSSVDCITALSTIEHGYNQMHFLESCRRLLKNGGTLWVTTDYRDDKITMSPDSRLFGLPYQVFSRSEIESLIKDAGEMGLKLVHDVQWTKSQYPIEWMGEKITFLLLGLRKTETGTEP